MGSRQPGPTQVNDSKTQFSTTCLSAKRRQIHPTTGKGIGPMKIATLSIPKLRPEKVSNGLVRNPCRVSMGGYKVNHFELKQQAEKKPRKMDLTWMDFPIGIFLIYLWGSMHGWFFMGKVVGMVNSTIPMGIRWFQPLTQLGQHLLRSTKFARPETWISQIKQIHTFVGDRTHIFIEPGRCVYVGYGPFPVRVTTRIITFLVGNPYKPLFATVTGKGATPNVYMFMCLYSLQNLHMFFLVPNLCISSVQSFYFKRCNFEPSHPLA